MSAQDPPWKRGLELRHLVDSIRDADDWRCTSCGEAALPGNPRWRWSGSEWQHHHGYPAGHLPAARVLPAMTIDETSGQVTR